MINHSIQTALCAAFMLVLAGCAGVRSGTNEMKAAVVERARALTITTTRDDIYAFFLRPEGIDGRRWLQGTKISNIDSNYVGQ